jgi:hypothetical protein
MQRMRIIWQLTAKGWVTSSRHVNEDAQTRFLYYTFDLRCCYFPPPIQEKIGKEAQREKKTMDI